MTSRCLIGLAAALLTTARVPASPVTVDPALVEAIKHSGQFDVYYDDQQKAVKPFFAGCVRYSHVTLNTGERIEIVTGRLCGCGNDNCQVAAFARDGTSYRRVLADDGRSDFRPNGVATLTSHQSAALSYRDTYRWNGSRYVLEKSEAVGYGRIKPISRDVRIAPGAYSAVVSGNKLTQGFDDSYVIDAASGQVLSLDVLAGRPHVGTLYVYNDAIPGFFTNLSAPGKLIRLPATGRYTVVVGGADSAVSSYALRITLR
jgi:hypothetical protein